MPHFKFNAVDAQGAAHAGEINSETRVAALDSLQQRGLTPVTLAELGAEPSVGLRDFVRARWRNRGATALSQKELATVTESIAALLRAGLTVDRALAITTKLTPDARVHSFLAELGKSVRAGRSLAEALNKSSQRLPGYYIGMVEAGEAGGSLASTLSRLAELLSKQQQVRERIRSALIYPALLAGVVTLTVVLLLTFVLPRFGALFAESETPLPWATRVVLATGSFVTAYWWLIALLVSALTAAAIYWIRSPRGRRRIDEFLLKSRLTLGLPAAIDTARMLRTLGTLLANGVQIGGALRIAGATLTNTRLRQGLDEAARNIKAGQSTSAALAAAQVFPAHAVQLARVGEETGRLEDLLLEAATILETESNLRLERLLALLVPLLTIGMGGLIAGLIGSVLIGLLSVNELAF
jgi:general secretion pathway protein F